MDERLGGGEDEGSSKSPRKGSPRKGSPRKDSRSPRSSSSRKSGSSQRGIKISPRKKSSLSGSVSLASLSPSSVSYKPNQLLTCQAGTCVEFELNGSITELYSKRISGFTKKSGTMFAQVIFPYLLNVGDKNEGVAALQHKSSCWQLMNPQLGFCNGFFLTHGYNLSEETLQRLLAIDSPRDYLMQAKKVLAHFLSPKRTPTDAGHSEKTAVSVALLSSNQSQNSGVSSIEMSHSSTVSIKQKSAAMVRSFLLSSAVRSDFVIKSRNNTDQLIVTNTYGGEFLVVQWEPSNVRRGVADQGQLTILAKPYKRNPKLKVQSEACENQTWAHQGAMVFVLEREIWINLPHKKVTHGANSGHHSYCDVYQFELTALQTIFETQFKQNESGHSYCYLQALRNSTLRFAETQNQIYAEFRAAFSQLNRENLSNSIKVFIDEHFGQLVAREIFKCARFLGVTDFYQVTVGQLIGQLNHSYYPLTVGLVATVPRPLREIIRKIYLCDNYSQRMGLMSLLFRIPIDDIKAEVISLKQERIFTKTKFHNRYKQNGLSDIFTQIIAFWHYHQGMVEANKINRQTKTDPSGLDPFNLGLSHFREALSRFNSLHLHHQYYLSEMMINEIDLKLSCIKDSAESLKMESLKKNQLGARILSGLVQYVELLVSDLESIKEAKYVGFNRSLWMNLTNVAKQLYYEDNSTVGFLHGGIKNIIFLSIKQLENDAIILPYLKHCRNEMFNRFDELFKCVDRYVVVPEDESMTKFVAGLLLQYTCCKFLISVTIPDHKLFELCDADHTGNLFCLGAKSFNMLVELNKILIDTSKLLFNMNVDVSWQLDLKKIALECYEIAVGKGDVDTSQLLRLQPMFDLVCRSYYEDADPIYLQLIEQHCMIDRYECIKPSMFRK